MDTNKLFLKGRGVSDRRLRAGGSDRTGPL